MNKQLLKDALGWGFVLWLIGYVLGIVFFFIVPRQAIGWFIMPIGTIVTLFVLIKKIKSGDLRYYSALAAAWTAIAVILDYLFIVKALNSAGGYYKPDVYAYYILTFILPLAAGYWKTVRTGKSKNQ